jgi:DNA-directed RNA polymerase subunit RPC12/RpoP
MKYNRRKHNLRFRYNYSEEQIDAIIKSQNYKCAICGDTRKLFVDHDHTTKKVRGLLCSKCNSGLGLLQDDSRILQNAIRYLEKFR